MPLTLIDNLKKLVPVNLTSIAVGVVISLFSVFVMGQNIYQEGKMEDFFDPESKSRIFGFEHFFKFFGLTCFSMEFPCLIFSMRSVLKKQTDFNWIFMTVSLLGVVLVILFGAFVYIVSRLEDYLFIFLPYRDFWFFADWILIVVILSFWILILDLWEWSQGFCSDESLWTLFYDKSSINHLCDHAVYEPIVLFLRGLSTNRSGEQLVEWSILSKKTARNE